jgi:hypothetical protein
MVDRKGLLAKGVKVMKAVDADRQIDQGCHHQGDQVGQVLG